MHITANTDVCVGSGMCALTAPDIFDQGDDGLVMLLAPKVPEELREVAAEAILLCPSGALVTRRPDTGD